MKFFSLLSFLSLLLCRQTNELNPNLLTELNETNIISYLIWNQKLTQTDPYKIFELRISKLEHTNRFLISGIFTSSPNFELDSNHFILIAEKENNAHRVLFSFFKEYAKGLNYKFINLDNDSNQELLLHYDLSGNGYTETYSEIYEGIYYHKIFESPMEYSAKDTQFKNHLSYQNGKNSFKDIFLYSKFKAKTCNVFTGEGCSKFSSHLFQYTKQYDVYTLTDQKDRDLYYGIFQID